jgi:hypothetical protein
VRPGRDADHSPLSSAEVMNEWELYLLSLQAPPWRVAGQLCFYFYIIAVPAESREVTVAFNFISGRTVYSLRSHK